MLISRPDSSRLGLELVSQTGVQNPQSGFSSSNPRPPWSAADKIWRLRRKQQGPNAYRFLLSFLLPLALARRSDPHVATPYHTVFNVLLQPYLFRISLVQAAEGSKPSQDLGDVDKACIDGCSLCSGLVQFFDEFHLDSK